MSIHSAPANRGFSLIEVTIASVILATAILSAGLLITKMTMGSVQSRDMSSASVLISEKIEDLNRWDDEDPQVCVPAGQATVGSLTADVTQTTTCPKGSSASVNYYDDVYPNLTTGNAACSSAATGCFAETVSSVVAGATVYTTTVHSPNGIVQSTSAATPPTGATFHRRWIIEANSPAAGVRRITVLVTKASSRPPITFQMSIVRP